MPGELSKKQLKGIKKSLQYDYLQAKELKKKRRQEKASRQKEERHKTRKQQIEELVETELEWEGEFDNAG